MGITHENWAIINDYDVQNSEKAICPIPIIVHNNVRST